VTESGPEITALPTPIEPNVALPETPRVVNDAPVPDKFVITALVALREPNVALPVKTAGPVTVKLVTLKFENTAGPVIDNVVTLKELITALVANNGPVTLILDPVILTIPFAVEPNPALKDKFPPIPLVVFEPTINRSYPFPLPVISGLLTTCGRLKVVADIFIKSKKIL
jgi:hypothetical protein